jgi:hypothetical protein
MHPGQYALAKVGKKKPSLNKDYVPEPAGLAANVSVRGPLPLDDETLLTSAQVRRRYGDCSAMCIWRWQRDEYVRFPAPVKINTRNYWTLGSLRRWDAEREAQLAPKGR